MKQLLLTTLLALAITVPGHGASTHPSWSYSGVKGPANWGLLAPEFFTCATGKNQSPINIDNSYRAIVDRLDFHYQPGGKEIVNNGHSIQINFNPGSSLVLGEHAYELKQLHFHTPSEHQIKGKSFPMEAHLVHADAKGKLAVVAILFRDARWSESLLQDLWKRMPMKAGHKVILEDPISPEDLLPSSKRFYLLNGSLTTPPCSEGVTWIVMKQAQDVTSDQVEKLLKAVGNENNRPVQPVNARIIVE